METMEDVKKSYSFSEQDEENLLSLRDLIEKNSYDFISKFYDYILRFKSVSSFLKDEGTIANHKEKVRQWFIRLFEGDYNEEYLRRLNRIGEVHVRIGLPGHYVNSSISFVRKYCFKLLTDEFGCSRQRDVLINSVDKIIDMNLDIMTISYREEELRSFILPRRLEYTMIEYARRFAFSLDLFLLAVLILTSVFVLGFVCYEVYGITTGAISIETGILKVLGTLLIIWAIGELLNSEIHHLKGGKFAVTAFLTLAIAAVIRKILIATLSTEKFADILVLGGIVLALGIVYWLIGHSNDKS
ncbi:MAG: phosphate-starvation-inducible PsiE family protein [Nitrospirae bacterium]|nr:phosphate-starvation-inducible PsiE family protein [Nitrospirota bacterium]